MRQPRGKAQHLTMPGHLFRSLDELPATYVELMETAGRENLYYSGTWFRNLIATTTDPGDEVLLFGVEDDDGLAQALFIARRKPGSGILGSRTLETFANFYTMIAGPIVRPGDDRLEDTLRELIGTVRRNFPAGQILSFPSMDPASPVFPALIDALSASGFLVRQTFGFGNWYEPTEAIGYAAYRDSLSSRTRNTIGRRTRKLEREHDVRYLMTDGGDGFDEAFLAYRQIYENSWKIPEAYPDFISGFLKACIAIGALRLGVLFVDGEPAAAQIWTICNGEATIYKLAYDEKFQNLSAGTVLTARMMEDVLEKDRPREIDYGFGDDPYKKEWTRHRRERKNLIAFRRATPAGALAAAGFISRQLASTLRDRLRPTA